MQHAITAEPKRTKHRSYHAAPAVVFVPDCFEVSVAFYAKHWLVPEKFRNTHKVPGSRAALNQVMTAA